MDIGLLFQVRGQGVAARRLRRNDRMSPESVAVVQRFGKYRDTASPGLHFKLPYGVK